MLTKFVLTPPRRHTRGPGGKGVVHVQAYDVDVVRQYSRSLQLQQGNILEYGVVRCNAKRRMRGRC